MKPEIYLTGDNTVLLSYPEKIDESINQCISVVARKLENEKIEGILDIVPTFHTIQIVFDTLRVDLEKLMEKVELFSGEEYSGSDLKRHVIEIPVCYDAPYGLDLQDVCHMNDISKDELIKRHSDREYLVHMLGFTPGFPYLGGMDETIATPRKSEPRKKIPKGSVGIAGSQTGIYPIESPGGWQIIGRTPVKLFDYEKESPVLLSAGAYIKFVSISKEQFEQLEKEA